MGLSSGAQSWTDATAHQSPMLPLDAHLEMKLKDHNRKPGDGPD